MNAGLAFPLPPQARPLTRLDRRLEASLRVLLGLAGQGGAAFQPPEVWTARREARVRALVAYAAITVPYYRDLFRRLDLHPESIRTADDLARLPLLEKAAVRADPQAFRSESPAGRAALPFLTSGSTGEPLTVYHDRASLLADVGLRERERQVMRRLLGSPWPPRTMATGYSGGTAFRLRAYLRALTVLPLAYHRRSTPMTLSLDEILERLNRQRPQVISGLAGFLETLFRYAHQTGALRHRPAAAVANGEGMSAEGRALIEQAFGVAVIAHYNAVECFRLGFQCERRRGYHLHADLAHLRLIDGDGRPASAGQSGTVVISNLVNRGTVLLNYVLGDVARFDEAPCDCGRTLPLLAEVEGRQEDFLLLPGGARLHPRYIWLAIRETPGLRRYQFEQRTLHDYLLRLAVADPQEARARLPSLLAALRGCVGAEANIDIELAAEWTGSPGKARPVISRLST